MEYPSWKLQADLFEIDVAQLVDQGQHWLELVKCTVVEMGGVKPETFDAVFGVFDDVLAEFPQNSVFRQVEASHRYLQHLYVFAWGQGSPCVAEEVVKHPLLVKMAVTKALQLDISDLYEPGFVNILLELFEFVFGAEKLGSPHVQFGDLSGIENQGHFLLN